MSIPPGRVPRELLRVLLRVLPGDHGRVRPTDLSEALRGVRIWDLVELVESPSDDWTSLLNQDPSSPADADTEEAFISKNKKKKFTRIIASLKQPDLVCLQMPWKHNTFQFEYLKLTWTGHLILFSMFLTFLVWVGCNFLFLSLPNTIPSMPKCANHVYLFQAEFMKVSDVRLSLIIWNFANQFPSAIWPRILLQVTRFTLTEVRDSSQTSIRIGKRNFIRGSEELITSFNFWEKEMTKYLLFALTTRVVSISVLIPVLIILILIVVVTAVNVWRAGVAMVMRLLIVKDRTSLQSETRIG